MLTQEQTDFQTDPLAIQFMTQGQMGYMPQAQFLTPSDYGAFRTLPQQKFDTFSHQDPSLLQRFIINTEGSLGFLPNYTFNAYNPAINAHAYTNKIRTTTAETEIITIR